MILQRKTIQHIYDTYRIPPALQMHQLRVAAVGKLVAEAQPVCDVNTVVTACLLHDMGNIIKFKLDRFPEFLEPEGYEYWAQVQFEYVVRYGWDEHDATEAICRELGVPAAVIDCIRAVGLTKINHNLAEGSLEECITNYADLRTGPRGLLSLQERRADARVRAGLYHDTQHLSEAEFEQIGNAGEVLEARLSTVKLQPAGLANADIARSTQLLGTFLV